MRRIIFIATFAAVAALAPTAVWAQLMSVDEVVKLVQNKISDNVIIAQIEETNSYFSLSTDDLIKLKQANASDALVAYMITRKPGGAPPGGGGEKAAGNGGDVSVRTAGRTSPEDETPAPPAAKFSDVNVNISGKYSVDSGADLNVFFAAYLDGERKYYRDSWTQILTLTSAESGATLKKWIMSPGSFSFKAPEGAHTLLLVCYSGPGVLDDAAAKSYVIYTQQITASEGKLVTINLAGETDAAGRFVIKR